MKTEAQTMREEFRAELDRLKIIGFPKIVYKIEVLNNSFLVEKTYTFDSEKEMNAFDMKELSWLYPAYKRRSACIIL